MLSYETWKSIKDTFETAKKAGTDVTEAAVTAALAETGPLAPALSYALTHSTGYLLSQLIDMIPHQGPGYQASFGYKAVDYAPGGKLTKPGPRTPTLPIRPSERMVRPLTPAVAPLSFGYRNAGSRLMTPRVIGVSKMSEKTYRRRALAAKVSAYQTSSPAWTGIGFGNRQANPIAGR